MEQAQLEMYRKRLLDEHKRLQKDIALLNEEQVHKLRAPGDLSNVPTHAADADVAGLAEHVRTKTTLYQEFGAIDDALERISDGVFGKCQRCGKEIASERLDAIPFVEYCIQCERAAEAT